LIQLKNEIKALGVFKVKINLHSEVQAEISIKVVTAETIQ
jgi:large subunit ribosomal protein L9